MDVHRFEILAQSTALTDLVAANDIYRDEFLAHFNVPSEPFMDWVQLERTRLEVIACGMLYRLAVTLSNANEYDAAIIAAQRLIALDPLREDGHRLLMQLFADVGRRSEAIRQFATCSDHLRRELDVAPDEKTIVLADAIRSGALMRRFAQGTSSARVTADRDAPVLVDADAVARTSSYRALDDQKQDAAIARIQHETRPSLHPVERRQLTVLACELGWSAAWPDTDELSEATKAYYRRSVEIIEQHHGYIARRAGDGLLAYFGYPHAREPDAEYSLRAALALQRLGAQLKAALGNLVQPCIGIASGIVVIGDD